MKTILLSLLLICVAMAGTPFFNEPPTGAVPALTQQLDLIWMVLIPLMVTMIILAAAAYVAAQLFGTETRAKATIWSQGMLVAVGIVVLIILLFQTIIPGFFQGQTPLQPLENIIVGLVNFAQPALFFLIITMVVIAALAYVLGQASGAETRARAMVWANNLLAGAFFGAALYVILFNILTQLGGSIFGSSPIGPYGNVLIQVAILIAIIIFSTYLISRFFKIPEWEAYLNIELSQLVSSFVVVLFVMGMFGAGELIASSYYDTTKYSNAPEASIAFMRDVVSKSALTASLDIYSIQACSSMLSTFSRRTGEFVLTQTYKVFPGMDTFVSASNVLSYTMISFFSTVSVQMALLHLVDAMMLSFFLPAGLVLRFFPPTRDAGAFLISLAFGFQIVFPLSYLINAQIFASIGATPYDSPTGLIAWFCGPFKYGAVGFAFNTAANPIYKLLPGLTNLGTLLGKLASESLLNMLSMSEFIPILERIASLSLLVLFMPALAMMITISFINVMTKFIVSKG